MVFTILACIAFAVRIPGLSQRPMHTDEAVNAYILGEVLSSGVYRYDNNDRHGPALSALALPLVRVLGASKLSDLNESTLRITAVFSGVSIIFLIALTAGVATENAVLAAALAGLFWAVNALPVYYSRYFIHEVPFVAATLGFLVFGWQAFLGYSPKRGVAAGICAAVMLACKETAILSFAPALVAGIFCFLLMRNGRNAHQQFSNSRMAVLMAGFMAFLATIVAFYSWGGHHWQGLSDLVHAIPKLTARASGQGHEKPFFYYFKLLGEGPSGWTLFVLASIGAISAFRAQWHWERFLTLYGTGVFLIYSSIPYKTPWLGLSLWLPIVLLAGSGCGVLWAGAERTQAATVLRVGLACAALLLVTSMAHVTWKRVFVTPSDERNPYAYAHTGEDLLRLPGRLAQLASEAGIANAELRIAIIAADPWPLPWYLRAFPKAGFWQPNQEIPDSDSAELFFTSMEAAELLPKPQSSWRPEFFGIRPGVLGVLWSRSPTEIL